MKIDKNIEYHHGNLTFVNYTQLSESDLLTILVFRNHFKVRQMTHNNLEISVEEHFEFIEKLKVENTDFYFAIKKNNKIIGSVSLTKCDFVKKYILAGVFLDPNLIGSGLGVELEFESIRLAFVTFEIETAGCDIFEENNLSHTIISEFNFKKIATNPFYSTYELSKKDWLKLPKTFSEFKSELFQKYRKKNTNKILPMLYFRKATLEDTKLYFDWANDKNVREQSFNSDMISYANHEKWFAMKLNDKSCLMLIFEDKTQNKIGQVRIQKNNEFEALIGISVAFESRGKGYAKEMIQIASDYFLNSNSDFLINAYIKESNLNSKFAFEKAGYDFVELVDYEGFKSYKYIKKVK